jgi:WhiB family redox-sensing transcriptional regulator
MRASAPAIASGPTDWMAEASCRGMPRMIFFPTDSTGVAIARRVCAVCPVKDLCLEHALAEHIDDGVWGGASEEERRRIRRPHQRGQAPRR